MSKEFDPIAEVILKYQDAVGRSDIEAIVALYSPDAVLMAQNGAPSVGIDAVRAAYAAMMQAIALDIRFTVAEVEQLAPDWAFLRSTSAGTITIRQSGATIPEANQELFLLRKLGLEWKIARYAFSETGPAPHS